MNDAREWAFARAVVRWVGPLAIVCTGAAFFLRGIVGMWTALGTVSLVGLIYAGSAYAQGFASRFGPNAAQLVALGGFFARLAVYAALLPILAPLADPETGIADRPTLVVVGVLSIVGSLAAEWWTAWSRPELWWLSLPDTDGRRPTAAEYRPRLRPKPTRLKPNTTATTTSRAPRTDDPARADLTVGATPKDHA